MALKSAASVNSIGVRAGEERQRLRLGAAPGERVRGRPGLDQLQERIFLGLRRRLRGRRRLVRRDRRETRRQQHRREHTEPAPETGFHPRASP